VTDWRPQASIDADALRHNLTRVRQQAPGRRIIAVIKADAYGHGLLPVAQILRDQVDMFAVARLHEAVSLCEAQPATGSSSGLPDHTIAPLPATSTDRLLAEGEYRDASVGTGTICCGRRSTTITLLRE